jgi:protease-4
MSMSADEVIADAGSLTGSIGVFALMPSVDRAWDKLSLHTHGTTTTWLAGALDPRRPLDPRARQLIELGVAHTYREFINRAAAARKIEPARMEELAQGRVWTGRQAHEQKLVDRLGTFHEALEAAARRGGLGAGFRVTYIEREPRGIDQLLGVLFGHSGGDLGGLMQHVFAPVAAALPEAIRSMKRELWWLRNAVREPLTQQLHCLCSADDAFRTD